MTKRSPVAHEAMILRLRLEFSLVSLEEVECWADKHLLAMSDPPYELIGVAMVRRAGREEGIRLLRSLGGEHVLARDVVHAIANADINGMSDIELGDFFALLSQWTWTCEIEKSPDQDGRYLKALWVAYEIHEEIGVAHAGIFGTLKTPRKHAQDFLGKVRELVVP